MSSAAVSAYSARSRASDRAGRIRENMNRSSAYILGNTTADYSTLHSTPTTTRRPRDSSIGTLGRPNSAMAGHSTYHRDSSLTRRGGRDSSLPRFKEGMVSLTDQETSRPRFKNGQVSLSSVPSNLVSSLIAVRHNIAMPELGITLPSETAKYNRQNAVKDIHNNFMKGLKDTNNKMSFDAATTEEIEKRSKSYQKIISDQPAYSMTEEQSKKYCLSEMFIDTGKFSTRTVSAINNLEGAEMRHKKESDYQWRKEMEDYEKSAEFAKEKRMRTIKNNQIRRMDKENDSSSIPARHQPIRKSRKVEQENEEEDHWATAALKQKQATSQATVVATKPAAAEVTKPAYVRPSQRQQQESNESQEESAPRQSWRERMAEKQKKEAEAAAKAQEEADARAKDEAAARAKAREVRKAAMSQSNEPQAATSTVVTATKSEADTAEPTEPPAVAAPPAAAEPAEGEDEDGTKKLKFDFDSKMGALEAEMAAGRSKLAKLRERIRKAKGAIKDADKALEDDDKKAAELQRKKDQRAATNAS